jgi:hypothetical protein
LKTRQSVHQTVATEKSDIVYGWREDDENIHEDFLSNYLRYERKGRHGGIL